MCHQGFSLFELRVEFTTLILNIWDLGGPSNPPPRFRVWDDVRLNRKLGAAQPLPHLAMIWDLGRSKPGPKCYGKSSHDHSNCQ